MLWLCTKIQINLFEQVDFSWFSPFMQPLEVINRLIIEFGYFNQDLNILKLLEFASEFSNLNDFIEEFYLSNIDIASHSKEGVMIMTIHGSKGLEFDHVIVVDRLKGLAPDRTALLYDYNDSLYIKKIYYKMRKRENFDEEYNQIVEKNKKLSQKDKMNLLYVALTRAVDSMIVIKSATQKSMFETINMQPMTLGKFRKITKKGEKNR